MILTHVRHGRTRRDATYLARHLMKADPGGPAILQAITGLAAVDLPGALHAMRRLAPARTAAFHHVALSPATDWTSDALRGAASRVVQELGGDPATHPHVVVLHRKPSASGRGALHAHVVVAHWNGTGPGLRDAWTHLKLERLAREMEWEAGEKLTRGRHDRAIAKALIARGRPEIAEALTAAGRDDLPRSPITSPARQALERRGVDDAAARRAVASAWSGSDTPAALRTALAAEGLCVEQGEKAGVWVIATAAGFVIGALDRIVRRRRAEVTAFMEEDRDDRIAPDRVGSPHPENRQPDRTPHAPPGPLAGAGGAEPAGADPGGSDRGAGGTARDPRVPASPGTSHLASARRRARNLAAAQALAAISIPAIRAEADRRHLQRRLDEVREFHDAARRKLAQAQTPMPTPASLIQAQTRADRSRQASRDAGNALREANARLEAIQASRPKGIAILTAWIGGRTRRRREEATQAAEDARLAIQRQNDAEHLMTVFQANLEAEAERVAILRIKAVAARRQLTEVAEHELAVAMRAAIMLRADPSAVSIPLTELLARADDIVRAYDLAGDSHRFTVSTNRPR